MKRIQEYMDYREFLRDYYSYRKKSFKYFSYRYFAEKGGIRSPSLLREVMEGKRNLTARSIPLFVKAMAMTETDGEFFTQLVHFNQARSPREKQRHLEQLRGLKRKIRQKLIQSDLYEYYRRWYNPVIRELVCSVDWGESYKKLAALVDPPIRAAEARESVHMLAEQGFIARNSKGEWLQKDPAITTGPEVYSLSVRKLNQSYADMGAEAIERIAPHQRDISSLVLGLSPRGYRLMKEEIQEFKQRLVRIAADDEESDRVYTLNMQLFPLSKSPEGDLS